MVFFRIICPSLLSPYGGLYVANHPLWAALQVLLHTVYTYRGTADFEYSTSNETTLIETWGPQGIPCWPGNRSKMLNIGAWGIRAAESRGRERFGMQNGGERNDLGCKMEGKISDLGARWRVRRLRIGYAAPGGACR